jgi:hypothetical protein
MIRFKIGFTGVFLAGAILLIGLHRAEASAFKVTGSASGTIGISSVARHACHWFRGGRPGQTTGFEAIAQSDRYLPNRDGWKLRIRSNNRDEPPSTRKLLLAMNDVSSEARNTMIPATSSGRPGR